MFVMWLSLLLRALLKGLTTLFGGLGIFFLYQGLADDPTQLTRALIFLGSATSLVWSATRLDRGPQPPP